MAPQQHPKLTRRVLEAAEALVACWNMSIEFVDVGGTVGYPQAGECAGGGNAGRQAHAARTRYVHATKPTRHGLSLVHPIESLERRPHLPRSRDPVSMVKYQYNHSDATVAQSKVKPILITTRPRYLGRRLLFLVRLMECLAT